MKRQILVVLVAVVFGLGAVTAVAGEEIPEPKSIWIAGVPNAVQVGDVVISGQPSATAIGLLKIQGYRTIVSARAPGEVGWDEAAEAAKNGLAFISIPMPSPVAEITDDQVARLAEAMQKAERPILLHCGSGNRIAGLWTVYLVEYAGVPVERALELGEKAGMRSVRAAVEKRLNSRR